MIINENDGLSLEYGKQSKNGAGYGIRVTKEQRDDHFKKKWDEIILHTKEKVFKVNISDSFWRNCTELRSKQIGQFLFNQGLAVWEKGNPPKLELLYISKNEFSLSLL